MKKVIYYILTSLMKREWLLKILTNKQEKALLEFTHRGYLYDMGWTNAISTGNIVDNNNDPLPWVSYPFMQFIAPRMNKNMQVFEFGSGNSTLYYAGRVAAVTSVEHDAGWYSKIKNSMPANVQLYFCELHSDGDYCKYAQRTVLKYDVMIIDGRDRVNCCINSINSLTPGGIIVLDDSEREKYASGISFLQKQGFKHIDFWGMAPAIDYLKCTTIFYRDGNCIGI
jgi:hypothetical protein